MRIWLQTMDCELSESSWRALMSHLDARSRAEDRVPVAWTVDAGDEDIDFLREHGSVALRRHRLRRLVAEARLQGAAPTHVELARALGYSVRTISRDFVATRAAGTRRMR